MSLSAETADTLDDHSRHRSIASDPPSTSPKWEVARRGPACTDPPSHTILPMPDMMAKRRAKLLTEELDYKTPSQASQDSLFKLTSFKRCIELTCSSDEYSSQSDDEEENDAAITCEDKQGSRNIPRSKQSVKDIERANKEPCSLYRTFSFCWLCVQCR